MKAALLVCFFVAQPLAQAAIIYQEIPVDEQIFVSGQRAFDFDGNGATDLTFSAVSPNFQLLTVTAGPIEFLLTYTADPGAYFTIQSSTDLETWIDQGSVLSTGISNTVLVASNAGDEKRFWRMRRGQ